ncbi:MAG: hypothetical protein ORN26_01670 [Candidatus Pacebacteria bacterium]|nr:hypothetical protein [Candidatus Paceibacterota bacterium]
MKLFEIQKKILLDKHRFKVVCAGRRAGKTDMVSEDMGYFMLQKLPESRKNKPIRILYSALTYSNAFEIMWDRFCNR